MQKVKILILILALFSVGCGTVKKKSTEEFAIAGVYNAEMFLQEVREYNLTKDSFYINKAEVQASMLGFNQNLIVSMKFKKPDSAMFIIKAKIGLEVARALITNDTIIINDRLNKRLILSGPEYFKRKYGLEPKLIYMIFGDFLLKPENIENQIKCQKNSSQIDFIKDRNQYLMKFDCISKKLKEASIESITRGKKVEFKYDEFVGNNKKKYPILSTILVPDEDINLILRIEKIDTNWDGNIDFVANNGYRRKVLK